MKTTIIFLVSLLITLMAWSNPQNQLPEEPWRAIVFMEKATPDIRWPGDISVKLMGNYTPQDSIMVENAIKTLNGLCETIQLSISKSDFGNLEIIFIDSLNKEKYKNRVSISGNDNFTWSYESDKKTKEISNYRLGLNYTIIPQDNKQHFITNTITYALYPKRLPSEYIFKRGREIKERPKSIFNEWSRSRGGDSDSSKWVEYEPPFLKPQTSFDQQLINAVYAKNFPALLTKAKEEFYLLPTWFCENSFILFLFPLILGLFILGGCIILLEKKLRVKIKNELLLFNLITIISLLILGVLISLYYYMSNVYNDPFFFFVDPYDIIGSTLFGLIIGLPALNLFRVIEKFIQYKIKGNYLRSFLIFLSTSLIPTTSIILFTIFINKQSNQPIDYQKMLFFILGITIISIFRAMTFFFIFKEKEILIENEIKLSALRELKTRAELNALHSKINPHFLYNSLNSIAGLAKTNADKTEHMALSLSKLFRYSINKEQSDWSTLAEELEMVNVYLDIEKVRFDDRLEFTIDLPEELKSVRIPQFLIQPLAENAIKHGISKLVSKGIVKITVRKVDQWIEIEVADNGPGFPNELNPGFGLQSIYDKLEILYPNRFELHFLNSPNKHILIKLA